MAIPHLFAEPQEIIEQSPVAVVDQRGDVESQNDPKPTMALVPLQRSAPPKPKFKWTQKARQAKQLLQEGELDPEEVAQRVGVTLVTISKWSSNPLFGLDTRIFCWTPQKEQAAAMLAVGKTQTEIAATIGCHRDRLTEWKKFPAFRERVAQSVRELRDAVMTQGIASKTERIKRLNERWQQIEAVRQARAQVYGHDSNIPGGATGIVVPSHKSATESDQVQHIGSADEFHIDTASIREERELAKQVAQEIGDWAERTENQHLVLVRTYGDADNPVDISKI